MKIYEFTLKFNNIDFRLSVCDKKYMTDRYDKLLPRKLIEAKTALCKSETLNPVIEPIHQKFSIINHSSNCILRFFRFDKKLHY